MTTRPATARRRERITTDADYELRDRLRAVAFRPVFIMGLHRSGTTFLYQTLADLLPVASLRVYHIAFFSRLARPHLDGTAQRDREALDAHFRQLGLSTRITDGIPLSHATVEEYGWLLQRLAGERFLTGRTRSSFEWICRKLVFVQPGTQAILLKNPWDTGLGPEILRLFPDARFIYLRREPVAILNSQFRNGIHFGAEFDPFLWMLLRGFALARLVNAGQRLFYAAAGRTLYAKAIIRWLMNDIAGQLQLYHAARAALPPASFLEVRYEDLLRAPAATLGAIARFLGLSPRYPLESIVPSPRDPTLLPEVAAWKDRFYTRLAAAGIPLA